MTDVEFHDLRDCGDWLDILECESVTGMRLYAVLCGERHSICDSAQFNLLLGTLTVCVFAGVEFNYRRTKADSSLYLTGIWLDEQADPYARIQQASDQGREMIMLPRGIKSTLGCPFLAPFWHDTRRMWFVAERNFYHLVGRGHLEVNWQAYLAHDRIEICVSDMAAVFAQMHGYAVAARCLHNAHRTHWIRMLAAARIADGRDMVDIDAEAKGRAHSFRLPGLTGSVVASDTGNSSAA